MDDRDVEIFQGWCEDLGGDVRDLRHGYRCELDDEAEIYMDDGVVEVESSETWEVSASGTYPVAGPKPWIEGTETTRGAIPSGRVERIDDQTLEIGDPGYAGGTVRVVDREEQAKQMARDAFGDLSERELRERFDEMDLSDRERREIRSALGV